GQDGRYKGLELVPIRTVITNRKIARQRETSSQYPQVGLPISGYELHQGRTQLVPAGESDNKAAQFDFLFEDKSLGIVDHRQALWGTYLHGLFDNGPWRRAWLNCLRQQRGLGSLPTGVANYREQREMMLDVLADSVESYLDLTPLLKP
ncbi:MAG: cobyric acid synthase CobQ, partial [Cyanobacteria bacterium P01_A01_bin.70]